MFIEAGTQAPQEMELDQVGQGQDWDILAAELMGTREQTITEPTAVEATGLVDPMSEDALDETSVVDAVTDLYTGVDKPAKHGLLDRWKSSKIMRVATTGLAALSVGSAIKAIDADSAKANTPTDITKLDNSFTVRVGQSSMSDSSFSKVTVLGNHRTHSKAEVARDKKEGNCKVFSGKNNVIYTEGHNATGNHFGRDLRRSLFCGKRGKSGKINWRNAYRAACGNAATINFTPRRPLQGKILWVEDYNSARMTVKAKSVATASGDCTSPDGLSHASAYGRAEGSASATLLVKSALKGKKLKEIKTETSLKASATASSKASATAIAICLQREATPPTPPTPVCTDTKPAVDCYPKTDGPNGQGAGSTGTNNGGSTVGGTGAGGTGGNTETGKKACYDDNTTTNGDQNPATEGAILFGKSDQLGYCDGPATATING